MPSAFPPQGNRKRKEVKTTKTITITLVEDDKSGGYTAFSYDIPDVISQGDTLSEAIWNFHFTLKAKEDYEKEKNARKTE
jgi:predicted RNase H-like HicB family nuclease